MIFIANVLTMNGGTTFLIRTCREFQRRGIPVAVLLLFPFFDSVLREELARYAKVIDLREFLWDRGWCFRAQFATFAPIRWAALLTEIRPFGNALHVMGVFGLLFACRLVRRAPGMKVTAGVYHQNEYLFTADDSFFVRTLRRCFTALSGGQVLFFNQLNMVNYGKFFGRDFSSCVIAPIGIDISEYEREPQRECEKQRLVSVGNLVNFKTYNRHVIGVVAKLAGKYDAIRYEIYGMGPEEPVLRELAQCLGVQDKVHFMGAISYSEFPDTVRRATLFIGSGTALLEAAALGVPAMVGIESIAQPETYGFLSDIEGLSYNEFMPEVLRVPMADLTDRLLSDEVFAAGIADACRKKAREFSVISTVDRIETMIKHAKGSGSTLGSIETILLCLSFTGIAVRDRLGLSSAFRNRRDQSF
ncbi:MAG TPA: glycosyltransferase family 4 protein [Noviherbaspirillum sp.]|nr:glycosyltransferase family 4 protein [Noviherbaspirillum sp.]